MSPTDETEVAYIINAFIPKPSSDHDYISNKLLKNILSAITHTHKSVNS